MRTIIFVILFSVLMVVPSYAMTGNEWLAKCENKNALAEQGVCLGYLKGMRDVFDIYTDDRFSVSVKIGDKSVNPAKYCKPKGNISLGQERKIAEKWLNEHPEHLHKPLIVLYPNIMREIFPCTENSTP
jgi:hypothetical protein